MAKKSRSGRLFIWAVCAAGMLLYSSAYGQVVRLELSSGRGSVVPGMSATVHAKAFDAVDAEVGVFDVTFSIVEGAGGGSLGPNIECDGDPAGSGHCVEYTPPDAEGRFNIRAELVGDPSINAEFAMRVVRCTPYPADGGMLDCAGPVVTPGFDRAGDLRLAVILLEPQNFQSADDMERQQFRDEQVARFYGPGNSVQRWFAENGIGAARLVGDAADVYGPYVMAHDWGDYFQSNGQLRWVDGHGLCFQIEGAALADVDIDYTRYNRVYFVVKGDASHNVWGWTNGLWNKQMGEGCVALTSARDGSLSSWKVGAHEFMHTLLMGEGMGWTVDLYGGADPRKVGGFDIMHDHTKGSQNTTPIKWAGGWVDPADQFMVPRPVGSEEIDQTVTLVASGVTESDPALFKTLMIPITDRKTVFVEARKMQAGWVSEQQLPGQGVIVTEYAPDPGILDEDRAKILLLGGPLTSVGQTYEDQDPIDPTRRLSVELTNVSGDNYTVRIRWRQFRPDPYIRPWEPPPWESVDIWNDSPLNNEGGSVVYAMTDASGNPTASGDPPSWGVRNNLQAKIHNGGNQDAAGVQVSFYWLDPSIGDPPANFIGATTVDIPAGGSTVAQVQWIPLRNPQHQCVKVFVAPYVGELNPLNNHAQENFHVQDSPSGSPYRPATMALKVNNPFDEPTFVSLAVQGLERGWRVQVEHQWVRLQARESKDVDVTITPPKELRDKNPQSVISVNGFAYHKAHDDAELMLPIGGVSILTRGVDPVPAPMLTVAPAVVPLGDQIRARVTAFPLINRPIAIVFKGPADEEQVVVGRNNTNRVMEVDFTPTVAGQWTTQARFMGDNRHSAAESQVIPFIVTGGPNGLPGDGTKPQGGHPDDCLKLCPFERFVLIIIAVALLVLVWLAIRRR